MNILVANIGSTQTPEQTKPKTITDSRATRTLPVRFSTASLTVPPSRSPATPAKNTADEKRADLAMSTLYSCRKNDGSQLRYSHSVQP